MSEAPRPGVAGPDSTRLRPEEPELKKPRSSFVSPVRALPVFGQALQAPPTYAASVTTAKAECSGTQLDEDLEAIPGPPGLRPVSRLLPPGASKPAKTSQPPWVQMLLDGMQKLHMRQDSPQQSLSTVQGVVQEHSQQIARLTTAQKDNATLHEHTLSRLMSLETEVKKLKASSRSVSPAPPVRERSLGPRDQREGRQGRSPTPLPGSRLGGGPQRLEDLQVLVGGWLEARRSDIEEELTQILKHLRLWDTVHEIVFSFVRSNIARIALVIPPGATLA